MKIQKHLLSVLLFSFVITTNTSLDTNNEAYKTIEYIKKGKRKIFA